MKPFSLLLCRHGYGDPLHLAGFTLKNEIEFCLFLCKELDANTSERKHPPPKKKTKNTHTHKNMHCRILAIAKLTTKNQVSSGYAHLFYFLNIGCDFQVASTKKFLAICWNYT